MVSRKKKRRLNHARLIVGEGLGEKTFLSYLKELYLSRDAGLSVKVKQAQGGDPSCIVAYAIRQARAADFDSVLVWMDTDVPWQATLKGEASGNRPPIMLLGSEPGLEGFLLAVLGEPVLSTVRSKKKLAQLTSCSSVTQFDFNQKFPRADLEVARKHNEVLDMLIEAVGKV